MRSVCPFKSRPRKFAIVGIFAFATAAAFAFPPRALGEQCEFGNAFAHLKSRCFLV